MTEAFAIRPVGEAAMLIDFGGAISTTVSDRVVSLDAALSARAPAGLLECVPAYTTLLLMFDPLLTTFEALEATVLEAMRQAGTSTVEATEFVAPVCYGGEFGPDLAMAAEQLGLTPEAVVSAHLAGEYRVCMYGFAPGYAYMAGVPPRLHLPRKPSAVRGYPVGSVMIAGAQCLITTLDMPTGWWVIGRSALRILEPEKAQPFLFKPGDRIRFEAVDAARSGLRGG